MVKRAREWLVERVFQYAKDYGYTKYPSTLLEPWRISIAGLTDSLELLMRDHPLPPALGPDDSYREDPASAFGLLEAQRHRSYGANFAMFISLFKYYAQSYHDLIDENTHRFENSKFYTQYISVFFDRVEIAYSIEWHGRSAKNQIHELEANVTLLKAAIENAPMSFVITDKVGNIEYVNAWFSRLTGYSFQEALGQNPKILKSGFTSLDEYALLWDEINHKHVWQGTFKNLKKNGEEYWESATIVPIRNKQDDIIHFLGIKQEITESQHLKELLLEKEEKIHDTQELMIAQSRHAAMGEMIGMIAHQWRQPLSIISMVINNMIMDIELENFDAYTCRTTGDNILTQINYLSKTIDDFRDFFRPNKQHEEVKVIDVVQESTSMIQASFENNEIELEIMA